MTEEVKNKEIKKKTTRKPKQKSIDEKISEEEKWLEVWQAMASKA